MPVGQRSIMNLPLLRKKQLPSDAPCAAPMITNHPPGIPTLGRVCIDLEQIFEHQPHKFQVHGESRQDRNRHVSNALTAFQVIFRNHMAGRTQYCRMKNIIGFYFDKRSLLKSIQAAQDFRDMAMATDSLFLLCQKQITYNYNALDCDLDFLDFEANIRHAATREYVLQMLVVMMIIAFEPNMDVDAQPKEKGLADEPEAISNMLRSKMPEMPATGRWQSPSEWEPSCRDINGISTVLPVHPSWCQEGSPLVRVVHTYAWSMGLKHAHEDFQNPSDRKLYRELISTEHIVMSAFRSIVGDFLSELEVYRDTVTTVQTKVVGIMAVLFTSCGSLAFHSLYGQQVQAIVYESVVGLSNATQV